MRAAFQWRKGARDGVTLLAVATALTLLSLWCQPKRIVWSFQRLVVEEVEVDAAEQWIPAPLWVDARSSAAFDQRHVPGAVLLNERSWNELLPGVLAAWRPDRRLIVYCDSSACDASQSVALRLKRELNLTEIHVLREGWSAWQRKHP